MVIVRLAMRCVLVMVMASMFASAQTQIGENTSVTMTGLATFGYAGTSSPDAYADGMNIGFSGVLNGYYYHPNFLNFTITPSYTNTKSSADIEAAESSKSFSSTFNLFSGSKLPIIIGFAKSWDSSRQNDILNTNAEFMSRGGWQSFTIGTGFTYKKLPPIDLQFGTSSSSSMLLGSDSSMEGHQKNFSIGSNYSFSRFNVTGRHMWSSNASSVPNVDDLGSTVDIASSSTTDTLSISRSLPMSSSFSVAWTRLAYGTSSLGLPVNSTSDALTAVFTTEPIRRLRLGFGATHGTNAGTLLVARIIDGSSSLAEGDAGDILSRASTTYDDLFATASYKLMNHWTVQSSLHEQKRDVPLAGDLSAILILNQSQYSTKLLGGTLGLGVSISNTWNNRDNETMGDSANVSYSHDVWGWQTSGNAQYSKNTSNGGPFSVMTSGYSFAVSTAKRLGPYNFFGSVQVGRSDSQALDTAESMNRSISAGVNYKRISGSGSYSVNNGNTLLKMLGSPDGLPLTDVQANLFSLYASESYSFTGAYKARRWMLTGDYVHSEYGGNPAMTGNTGASSFMTRYNVKATYYFRQIRLNGGYYRISQSLGPRNPVSVGTVYIGVSRRFDLF